MKSTLFSKGLLLASGALILGSSTASFAAPGGQLAGGWTTVPGSACFAEDRANVSSFEAPGSAGIMLKTGEAAQWVVCPVPKAGLTATDAAELRQDITVVVDKASAATALYCYSSIIEDDGKSGAWTELHVAGAFDAGEVGIKASAAESGVQTLTAEDAGISKAAQPDIFEAATYDKNTTKGFAGALGVACLLSPGDKVLTITTVANTLQ